MTNRAIELAKECNIIYEAGNDAYRIGLVSRTGIQAFYEAAKRDGMIEMRERAAKACDKAGIDLGIRALEVE